ncbi:hypothetical protein J4G37_20355 [Microvirga sp. 3-52]|nr:hypothetical protein [Microvirga sp. 3-52]
MSRHRCREPLDRCGSHRHSVRRRRARSEGPREGVEIHDHDGSEECATLTASFCNVAMMDPGGAHAAPE